MLLLVTGPLGAVTQFAYDLAGRVVNLLIGENSKKYSQNQGAIKVTDRGDDDVHLSVNTDSTVSAVKILYKKSSDSSYQSSDSYTVSQGANQINLQGLLANTNYDYQIQYIDKEADVSYSRKYSFKTTSLTLPVILSSTTTNTSDNTASLKISVSKDISSSQIRYHVRGESIYNTVITKDTLTSKSDGLTFNLENLRSGQTYDCEITITDRLGNTSTVNTASFTTTGTLSAEDSAIHAVSGFGQVLATLSTQAYISLQDDRLSNPQSEAYTLTVKDSSGTIVSSLTASWASIGTFDTGMLISGLTSNTNYTYNLITTSRSDISPVSGSFTTSTGTDTTAPNYTSLQAKGKDSFNRLLSLPPTEALRTLLVTMTNTVTQAVKRYYYFDIAQGSLSYFLQNSLDAGTSYTLKWLMIDTSGNMRQSPFNLGTSTPVYDESSPLISSNTITNRTATSLTMHLTTNESIKNLRIRYRIIGNTQWIEQSFTPNASAYDITLSNLTSGQSYEYQYILNDNSNNQCITGWVRV